MLYVAVQMLLTHSAGPTPFSLSGLTVGGTSALLVRWRASPPWNTACGFPPVCTAWPKNGAHPPIRGGLCVYKQDSFQFFKSLAVVKTATLNGGCTRDYKYGNYTYLERDCVMSCSLNLSTWLLEKGEAGASFNFQLFGQRFLTYSVLFHNLIKATEALPGQPLLELAIHSRKHAGITTAVSI